MIPLLALNPYLQGLLVVLFLCVSFLLILVVLIQRPSGGGLAGAFGSGSGSGQTAFGTKTGDALTIATIILFTVFVLGAIVLNFTTRPPALVAETTMSGEGTTTTLPVTPSTTPPTAPVNPAPANPAPASGADQPAAGTTPATPIEGSVPTPTSADPKPVVPSPSPLPAATPPASGGENPKR